jgi:ATP-dependent HslUV protease ATP-binding subunit HslU
MERVLDDVSFNAPDRGGHGGHDRRRVRSSRHVGDLAADTDLSRYIL